MKQYLFTFVGWYCWAVHTLIVLGALCTTILAIMQFNPGVQVYINLPTIERTFARK